MEEKKLNVGPYMPEKIDIKMELQMELKLLKEIQKTREIIKQVTSYESPKVGPYDPFENMIYMPEDDSYIKITR